MIMHLSIVFTSPLCHKMIPQRLSLLLVLLVCILCHAKAFCPLLPLPERRGLFPSCAESEKSFTRSMSLFAAGGKKKKRRRRKQPPGATAPDPVKDALEKVEGVEIDEEDDNEELTDKDRLQIEDVAKFEFQPPKGDLPKTEDIALGVQDEEVARKSDGAIPLPDIKEAKRKKKMEEELARMEEEKEEKRVRIKRSDKEAFTKLLEQQPFADADDSFFEEEEYDTVSALLGERAAPFLGIPSGPLQVGHFIGALGIMLMAFIEYPGFPLTNLPTPLRDCLQGGLGTVYTINTVLAVLAAFKAGERGQPRLLWIAKTFSVGGLAYDQLTQLPTLEQIEKAKNRKGARALKKR